MIRSTTPYSRNMLLLHTAEANLHNWQNNSTIFKQETIKSWFTGVSASVNNEIVQPFQNAKKVIDKYNLAIQHNSLTQKGWERLLAQSDDGLKSYLSNIKGSIASMGGYLVSLQGSVTGFNKVSTAITQYNSLHESGSEEQNAFSAAVSLTNGKLGSYLSGLKGAEASLGGYVIFLASATVKTIALQAATIALNTALTMGISLLFSSIVSAISNWIHKTENIIEASEKAGEKIKSINEELKRNQEVVSDSAKRYAELAQGVDQLTGKNISLTDDEYEEFLSLSNQLAEIFPTLTRNYDENGNAIIQLNGDVNTIVGSLRNLIEAQKDLAREEIVKELPNKFKGVVENSNQYETELKDLKDKREAILQGLEEVSSDSLNEKVQTGLNDKYFEVVSNNLDEYSRLISDYQKILADANLKFDTVNFDPIWNGEYDNNGKQVLTYKASIYIESSDEDIENAKNIIGSKTEDLAAQYETNISELNEKIKNINEKNKSNWYSLSSSIFAWLSTDDSFKVMDDNMQAAIQNIVNNLNWSSLDFSSWNDAKQYIQDNILSLFDTIEGKETLDNIQLMFDIKTQFNNGDISINEYQGKLQEFLSSIEDFPDDTKKSIMWLFGIEINEDNTTTSDIDNLINNVKGKLKDKFDNKVGELTLEELKIATEQIEIPEGTLLSWDELITKIKEVQNSGIDSSLLSLPDAIKKVNGFKEGDTEVIGLIEEYELLQEVLSDTGNIQEETYEKLLSCSSKYSTAIRTENGRITVNTSKLKAVAKSRQLDTKEAIRQTLALKKQEWVQWNQGIENYNGTLLENIETTYGDIDALQHQITQYELLVNSVDEASNAFKRFEAAQSVDEQDMFTTAQNAFDLVNETLNKTDSENYGKTNTKKFQYGMELLADDEDYEKLLNAESMEDYVRISKEIVKTLSPLFTENEGLGVDNLFKRADAIVDSGDIPKNDKEWADKLNTSVEMFQALKQRANLYEYNNREYFSSGFTNKLDEYQSRLSNVQSAQEALNECTDTTSNEYKRLSKELDDAKQKYNEFKNETADTVEDAYTGFIHSGAKSKGSFSDYLKQSMGMEDSDITGMIDVLLDKSKSLQENLSNMHPDSTAYELYKKQLDDVNSLIASLDFDIDSIDKTKSLEDKISQYKELAKEAEEYKKTLETEDSGSESYKEAAQELERISVLMNELRDPLRLEINSNISEIESQISQLDEKLKGLNEALKHASSSNEAYAIHMDIKGSENEKAKLEGQKKELQETVKLIVDSTEIDEYKPEEKEGTVKYSPDFSEVTNVTPPVLKGTVEYEAKMPNQPITPVSPKPKQADADGTFHAFAQGTGSDVSIAKDEKALVNELGEEGIVRNGKLIPIKGGAQFVNLKRGDIIFNH